MRLNFNVVFEELFKDSGDNVDTSVCTWIETWFETLVIANVMRQNCWTILINSYWFIVSNDYQIIADIINIVHI